MLDKVQRVLSVLQWVALGIAWWFVVTGRSMLWMGPTLLALIVLSRGLDAWIDHVPRGDFKKPRSFYPNGDNGYNDRNSSQ